MGHIAVMVAMKHIAVMVAPEPDLAGLGTAGKADQ